ncbi:MAG: LPXTG cell wall anchor domain-containing protein [Bryobacteraceae bacterium]|jgi:LPXTG-motif cell wall-anchored protein
MNNVKIITLVCVGALGLMLPQAKADQWNQKTIFTFTEPVEIPGGVVLSPGTYVFKLLDSQSDRNIVEVFNQREDHVFGTFIAIANYRLRPTGKSILTFEERAAGTPQAVRAWFYPGENYGHQFVYPKARAAELAKANNQPVASTETTTATAEPSTLQQAPVKAQTATGQEVDLSEAFATTPTQESAQTQEPAPTEQAQNQEPAPAPQPAALPETGSSMPLFGLIGLLSLAGAGFLRRANAVCK